MSRRALLLGLSAVVFFALIYLVRIRDDMADFEVNLRAAERFKNGELLYQTTDGHFMFKYFPFSALLYVPLTFLPLEAAKASWYAIGAFATILMFVLSRRLVSGALPRPWAVVWLPAIVLAKFCLRELKLGQINTLVTVVLLLMVMAIVARRRVRAGVLWGVSAALKPYGLIFFPYFVVKRDWTALGSGLAVLAAAFCLPAVAYGFGGNLDLHRQWYQSLAASTPAQFGGADNVSLVGAFTKWTGDPQLAPRLALVFVAMLALLVLAVVWRGRELDRAGLLECALLLTLIPMVSPMGWDYQFLTSALAVTLLVDRFSKLPLRWLLGVNFAVIGLSIYDVLGRAAYHRFMSSSVLTVCFVVVIAYLASLRWARLA